MSEPALLDVRGLTKAFRVGRSEVRAVRGVSFSVRRGESVGLVGESGCGKTTTARCIVGLERIDRGEIDFDGRDTSRLPEPEFRRLRSRIQMVFQDSVLSLNPLFTVRRTVEEPLMLHGLGDPAERLEQVTRVLEMVGLDSSFLRRFPQQLSGGQSQRVAIARAIAVHPDLVVLDEPTSSLDMSSRLRMVRLMVRLQEQLGMACLFISHDLGTIRHLCRRLVVMYLGRVVESGPVSAVYRSPRHPYTEALLSAVPSLDPSVRRRRVVLTGEAGGAAEHDGCAFAPRCPYVQARCRQERPPLREIEVGQFAACHFAESWPNQPRAAVAR